MRGSFSLRDTNAQHLDGLDGVVVARRHLGDLDNQVIVFANLSKHRVGRVGAVVEPIQKGIVCTSKHTRFSETSSTFVTASPSSLLRLALTGHVNKELGSTGFRTSGVGHGKSSGRVGDPLMRLANLVRNASTGIALVRLAVTASKGGSSIRSASSSPTAVGVLGVGATELVHETGNDTVKVDTVIKTRIGQINEISDSDRHLVGVQFGLEGTHGGSEGGGL